MWRSPAPVRAGTPGPAAYIAAALNKARRSSLIIVVAASVAGCGSSPSTPADGGADASTDGPPGLDGAAFVVPRETRLLVAGRAWLVGSGPNSCTNQPGPADGRWCAFVRPAGGGYELWVFDAAYAAAGGDLRCDGTDPRCLRLSTSVLYSDFAGASAHAFQGDTLFYRAGDGANAADLLGGPVWAWRPGWPAGRELVSGAGTSCAGAVNGAAALCVRRVTAANGDVSAELTSGPLTLADAPLPVAGTVLLRSAADPANATDDLETGFSPDGTYAAWSSRGVLTVEEVGKPGTRAFVADDVASWRISPDGTSWLWLRAFHDDGLEPAGTLEVAQFPTGSAAQTLAAGVADFDLVGARGVLFRAAVADQVGELRLMPDRAAPAATTKLDDGVRTVVARSDDAKTIVYTNATTAVGDDLYASSPARGTPCALTDLPTALRMTTLMAGDRVAIWAQRDVISQLTSGAATSLATCETTSFGRNLARALPLGDERVLYIDDAPSGAAAGTLRAALVTASGVGATAPLQRDVDFVFAPLPPRAVAFTVSAGTAADGLYVYAWPLGQSDGGSD